MWQIWIVFYVEGCGVSSAVIPCSFSECVESFFVVHSWQNGTRCRDGVNVLWCCSILFGWFLRVPSLHCDLFLLIVF